MATYSGLAEGDAQYTHDKKTRTLCCCEEESISRVWKQYFKFIFEKHNIFAHNTFKLNIELFDDIEILIDYGYKMVEKAEIC